MAFGWFIPILAVRPKSFASEVPSFLKIYDRL